MSKVYCDDCKHHHWNRIFPMTHFCKLETMDTPTQKKFVVGAVERKNRNNDCKDFKRRTFWDLF